MYLFSYALKAKFEPGWYKEGKDNLLIRSIKYTS